MDFTYVERPVFTKGWRSKDGLMPSDYWKRNMFVEFMEDDIGIKLRDYIGVENMLWGSDYPHAEATFPRFTSNFCRACSKACPRRNCAKSPRRMLRRCSASSSTDSRRYRAPGSFPLAGRGRGDRPS